MIELSIRVEAEDRLVADVQETICNDYVNDLAVQWNTQRKEAARYACVEVNSF